MRKKGYEIGGRNVFEDLGVPNADEHVIKAQLVFKIETIMIMPCRDISVRYWEGWRNCCPSKASSVRKIKAKVPPMTSRRRAVTVY